MAPQDSGHSLQRQAHHVIRISGDRLRSVRPDGIQTSWVDGNTASCFCSSVDVRTPAVGTNGPWPPGTYAHAGAAVSFDDGHGNVVTKFYLLACQRFDAPRQVPPLASAVKTAVIGGGQRSPHALE